jgi:uncharacterized protein YjbI with pentapeptide repeats
MYTSIYSLPQNETEDSSKYQNRWKTKEGILTKQHILKLLREETTEHFLQKDFTEGTLNILENATDLKGLRLEDEHIKEYHPKTFTNVNFSYSFITHSEFEKIFFPKNLFHFATLNNVTFINCTFSSSCFYACRLENAAFINCDFVDRVDMRNCSFYNVRLVHCFFETNIFYNCKFNQGTIIDEPATTAHHIKKQTIFDKKEYAQLYKSIKNAYHEGSAIGNQRKYYFLEKQSITRYNTSSLPSKINNYFIEFITGYGIRPLRVFLSMVFIFIFFTAIFIEKLGYPEGVLLSIGAFFTNGAASQHLTAIGSLYLFLYLIESFVGIVFIALFITVIANLWFQEK